MLSLRRRPLPGGSCHDPLLAWFTQIPIDLILSPYSNPVRKLMRRFIRMRPTANDGQPYRTTFDQGGKDVKPRPGYPNWPAW
jgi:hypothetical protein